MANNLQVVKKLLNTNEMQSRFREILGQKAPQFMASIVNAVSGNSYLQQCDANSVMAAALVAATLDLPIDSNLGFAAIVPYKVKGEYKAQFIMQYKGFVQLAIRSGYYEKMNYSEVYEDELKSYNPITGEVTFVDDFSKCRQREEGQSDKIIGYYAWFRLRTGFSQEIYMSRAEVDNHARKYSQSYRTDINKNRSLSLWSTDFDIMAKKTVIKRLLSRWGILSVDMQQAIQVDQKVYDQEGTGTYADNNDSAGEEAVIDVFANTTEQVNEAPEQNGQGKAEQRQTEQQDLSDFMDFDEQYAESEGELPFK